MHLSHAVATEEEDEANTTKDAIVKSLDKVGVSIMKGGCSTFMGICMLAFAESAVFRIFFKVHSRVVPACARARVPVCARARACGAGGVAPCKHFSHPNLTQPQRQRQHQITTNAQMLVSIVALGLLVGYLLYPSLVLTFEVIRGGY